MNKRILLLLLSILPTAATYSMKITRPKPATTRTQAPVLTLEQTQIKNILESEKNGLNAITVKADKFLEILDYILGTEKSDLASLRVAELFCTGYRQKNDDAKDLLNEIKEIKKLNNELKNKQAYLNHVDNKEEFNRSAKEFLIAINGYALTVFALDPYNVLAKDGIQISFGQKIALNASKEFREASKELFQTVAAEINNEAKQKYDDYKKTFEDSKIEKDLMQDEKAKIEKINAQLKEKTDIQEKAAKLAKEKTDQLAEIEKKKNLAIRPDGTRRKYAGGRRKGKNKRAVSISTTKPDNSSEDLKLTNLESLNEDLKSANSTMESVKKEIEALNEELRNARSSEEIERRLKTAQKNSADAFGLLVNYFRTLAEITLVFRKNANLSQINPILERDLITSVFTTLSIEKPNDIQKIFFTAKEAFQENPSLLSDLYISMEHYIYELSKKRDAEKGIEWEVEVTYWIFKMLKVFGEKTSSLRMNQHQETYSNCGQDAFSKEIDIISDEFFVECKNITWEAYDNPEKFNPLINQFRAQKLIANRLQKIFCIISKTVITQQNILEFLTSENINFIDPKACNQPNFLIDASKKPSISEDISKEKMDQIEQEIQNLRDQIRQQNESITELKKKTRNQTIKTKIKNLYKNLKSLEENANKKSIELSSANKQLECKPYSTFASLYNK